MNIEPVGKFTVEMQLRDRFHVRVENSWHIFELTGEIIPETIWCALLSAEWRLANINAAIHG